MNQISRNEMIQKKDDKKQVLNDEKYRDKKAMSIKLAKKLDRLNFVKESISVEECGNYLLFSKEKNIETNETKRKLKKANFCKFRHCPICNWKRNINIHKSLLEAFKKIEADRKVEYLLLTLTIRNPETNDLKKSVKYMNDSLLKMKKYTAFKRVVLGYFKSLEILGKKTEKNQVHPHFHIILVVSSSYFKGNRYLSQKKWTEMWQKALKVGYTPLVNVKSIRPKNKKLQSVQSAVLEVAKYSVKHTDLLELDDEDFSSIIQQTKRMRFYSTSGILKEMMNLEKIEKKELVFSDDIEELWIEIEEELFQWYENEYILSCKQKKSI